MAVKLTEKFFHRDALEVAPELVGKIIVHRLDDGTLIRERIAETEAYRGEEDKGCHASKGRTKRTGAALRRKRCDIRLSLLWNALAYECYNRRYRSASGSFAALRRDS